MYVCRQINRQTDRQMPGGQGGEGRRQVRATIFRDPKMGSSSMGI